MAKRNRQIARKGQNFVASEQVDDHLLPTAGEIQKYKEADPELPKFLREAASEEQKFRHSMNAKGMKLSFREQFLQYGLNYLGIICASGVAAAGFWFSYKLLLIGFEIQGTIFSGATLVYMAYLFLRRGRVSERPKPPNNN